MVSYLAQRVKILLRACLLLLLYLLWLKRIVESFFTRSCVHKLCFVLFCCSIFNDQSLAVPPLGCATRLLYHTAPPLSSPFLNFFKNFFDLPKLSVCAPLLRKLCYYITPLPLCQEGLEDFSNIPGNFIPFI